jgi:hypothetical protein
MAQVFMKSSNNLDIIITRIERSGGHQPSWVPNWEHWIGKGNHGQYMESYHGRDSGHASGNASGDIPPYYNFLDNGRTLHTRGVYFAN